MMENLFNGLKEDNEKLASELKRMSDENFELQQYLGVSKETIQQQNGIIKNLQSVIDSYKTLNQTNSISNTNPVNSHNNSVQ